MVPRCLKLAMDICKWFLCSVKYVCSAERLIVDKIVIIVRLKPSQWFYFDVRPETVVTVYTVHLKCIFSVEHCARS